MIAKALDRIRARLGGQNPNVFFLGVVSFLTDISSEMIFTIVPLFLSNVLGCGTTTVGVVGGISESADAIFRIGSGWLSDRLGKRKSLTVAGYLTSTIAKPFMYLASTWGLVLGVRLADRVGKGLRSSPRDALIADSVAPGERGRSFGLHRAMDTSGAVVGLSIAALVIFLLQGGGLSLNLETYRWLIWLGTIPAGIAVFILVRYVKEKRKAASSPTTPRPSFNLFRMAAGMDRRFKLFLGAVALFTLGNSSDFFVILRAQDMGASVFHIVLMLVVFNAAYAAVSLPAGRLSDRLGRKRVILAGWAIYAAVYLGFAVAGEVWHIWLLFAAYGAYYGIVEGSARAFVADMVPPEKRGTAYGLFQGVVGLTLLPASIIAGWLWQLYSPSTPFFFGAALAGGAVGMMTLVKERKVV